MKLTTERVAFALADGTRVKVLRLMCADGEKCVSQLCEVTGMSQPAMSHHLTKLKNADLIEFRRDGRYTFYRPSKLGRAVLEAIDRAITREGS